MKQDKRVEAGLPEGGCASHDGCGHLKRQETEKLASSTLRLEEWLSGGEVLEREKESERKGGGVACPQRQTREDLSVMKTAPMLDTARSEWLLHRLAV